jgi:hypothetical protein
MSFHQKLGFSSLYEEKEKKGEWAGVSNFTAKIRQLDCNSFNI